MVKGRLGLPPCFVGSSSVHSINQTQYLGHTVCDEDEIDKVDGTTRQPIPFLDAVNFCRWDLQHLKSALASTLSNL